MKTISPVSVWYNGSTVSADKFRLICISNNLVDTASYFYELIFGEDSVVSGNLNMVGGEYSTSISNNGAYNWAAGKLGLTII
jgi:hypothetical protein